MVSYHSCIFTAKIRFMCSLACKDIMSDLCGIQSNQNNQQVPINFSYYINLTGFALLIYSEDVGMGKLSHLHIYFQKTFNLNFSRFRTLISELSTAGSTQEQKEKNIFFLYMWNTTQNLDYFFRNTIEKSKFQQVVSSILISFSFIQP